MDILLQNVYNVIMGERKIHNRHRSCFTKKAYETESKAIESADWVKENKGVELTVYYCELCSAWHLARKKNGK